MSPINRGPPGGSSSSLPTMGRKRVKLAFIENNTARRVSLRKRSKGLLKKTEELSTLCEVKACSVIYSPCDPVPLVWPAEAETRRILLEYLQRPAIEKSQRQYNQERFIKDSVNKTRDRLAKLQRKMRELEMENLIIQLLQLGKPVDDVQTRDVGDLLWTINDKLRVIEHRLDNPPAPPPPPPPAVPAPVPALPPVLPPANYHPNAGINHAVSGGNLWGMEAGPSGSSANPMNGTGFPQFGWGWDQ